MKLTTMTRLLFTGLFAFGTLVGNAAAKEVVKQTASHASQAVGSTTHSAHHHGFHQVGQATYYGGRFHGRRTASGEVFDKNGMTAAHRTLPFGTYVRVTHLGTGRSVVVKITDRGPFGAGKIIDLSEGAAAKLNILRAGVAQVKLESVSAAEANQHVTEPQAVSSVAHSTHKQSHTTKSQQHTTQSVDKKSVRKADRFVAKNADKKRHAKASKWAVSVAVKSSKEAKKLAANVKQKASVKGNGKQYWVVIESHSAKEQHKIKRQLAKLGYAKVSVAK